MKYPTLLAVLFALPLASASAQTWIRVLPGPGDDFVHAVRELPGGSVAVLHDVAFGSGRLSILDAGGQALSTSELTGRERPVPVT